jgi:Fe-S-cluster containining protein
MQTPDNHQAISACRRCGTCCKKGGPCLHDADRVLVESGIIPLADLWTIRVGEMVNDPIAGTVLSTDDEIIKINGRSNSPTCLYFDDAQNTCEIYMNRPLECRILKCWDTREIELAYHHNRLGRKAVLSSIEGIWDLIETHEIRCSVRRFIQLVRQMKSTPMPETNCQIQEMIAWDREIRQLTIQKSGIDSAILPFLFGRPLTELKIQNS